MPTGNIDEEDPAPREIVGDPSAQRGADGWRKHRHEAIEREGLPAFMRLKRVRHDRLRHGLHAAAAGALDHAKDQQQRQRRRRAAKETGNGEDSNAEDEEIAAAHQARSPSAQRQHDRIRDQVACQHPRSLVRAGAQGAGDMRQRDVGNRGVEHLHKGRQGHRHGNQPRVDARLPGSLGGRIWIRHRRSPPSCVRGRYSRRIGQKPLLVFEFPA